METKVSYGGEVEYGKAENISEYREEVRRLIETEVRDLINEEIRKAGQEIMEE